MTSAIANQDPKTQFVKAGGITYAFRRLGPQTGIPLLMLIRIRATMDDWDPALIHRLARERPAILFDNAGIGLSTGQTPDTVQAMAERALAFASAIGLERFDLFGFSMGGYIAQTIALAAPELVRRLVLAGTGPGGGEGIVHATPQTKAIASKPVLTREDYMVLFFSPSEASPAEGHRYWDRLHQREGEREPELSIDSVKAQAAATGAWWAGIGNSYPRLGEIRQPTLVANGSNDVMVPTINSYIMAQRLPDANLVIYPDSNHGFLFQHHEKFSAFTLDFLR